MVIYREVLSIIGSGEGDVREAKIIDLFKKVGEAKIRYLLDKARRWCF